LKLILLFLAQMESFSKASFTCFSKSSIIITTLFDNRLNCDYIQNNFNNYEKICKTYKLFKTDSSDSQSIREKVFQKLSQKFWISFQSLTKTRKV
jgi:hypothetical protein